MTKTLNQEDCQQLFFWVICLSDDLTASPIIVINLAEWLWTPGVRDLLLIGVDDT